MTQVGRLFEEEKQQAIEHIAEITEAKTIVMLVDKKITKLGSIEAACEDIDIPIDKYLHYKEILIKSIEKH